jgi:hypothetical protein
MLCGLRIRCKCNRFKRFSEATPAAGAAYVFSDSIRHGGSVLQVRRRVLEEGLFGMHAGRIEAVRSRERARRHRLRYDIATSTGET